MSFSSIPLSSQSAPIDEYIILWTANKHQRLKKWHDGFLRYHTFNKRLMVYDEFMNKVCDKFVPDHVAIEVGDEVTFDSHLVTVEDVKGRQTQDLRPIYEKTIERRKEKEDARERQQAAMGAGAAPAARSTPIPTGPMRRTGTIGPNGRNNSLLKTVHGAKLGGVGGGGRVQNGPAIRGEGSRVVGTIPDVPPNHGSIVPQKRDANGVPAVPAVVNPPQQHARITYKPFNVPRQSQNAPQTAADDSMRQPPAARSSSPAEVGQQVIRQRINREPVERTVQSVGNQRQPIANPQNQSRPTLQQRQQQDLIDDDIFGPDDDLDMIDIELEKSDFAARRSNRPSLPVATEPAKAVPKPRVPFVPPTNGLKRKINDITNSMEENLALSNSLRNDIRPGYMNNNFAKTPPAPVPARVIVPEVMNIDSSLEPEPEAEMVIPLPQPNIQSPPAVQQQQPRTVSEPEAPKQRHVSRLPPEAHKQRTIHQRPPTPPPESTRRISPIPQNPSNSSVPLTNTTLNRTSSNVNSLDEPNFLTLPSASNRSRRRLLSGLASRVSTSNTSKRPENGSRNALPAATNHDRIQTAREVADQESAAANKTKKTNPAKKNNQETAAKPRDNKPREISKAQISTSDEEDLEPLPLISHTKQEASAGGFSTTTNPKLTNPPIAEVSSKKSNITKVANATKPNPSNRSTTIILTSSSDEVPPPQRQIQPISCKPRRKPRSFLPSDHYISEPSPEPTDPKIIHRNLILTRRIYARGNDSSEDDFQTLRSSAIPINSRQRSRKDNVLNKRVETKMKKVSTAASTTLPKKSEEKKKQTKKKQKEVVIQQVRSPSPLAWSPSPEQLQKVVTPVEKRIRTSLDGPTNPPNVTPVQPGIADYEDVDIILSSMPLPEGYSTAKVVAANKILDVQKTVDKQKEKQKKVVVEENKKAEWPKQGPWSIEACDLFDWRPPGWAFTGF